MTKTHRLVYGSSQIETWGRGVEKIFETCEELGTPKPEYSILGNGVTVRFPVLQSAISNVPKHQNEALDDSLEAKTIRLMKDNVHITQAELMQKLHVSRATVSNVPNVQNEHLDEHLEYTLENRILTAFRNNPKITYADLESMLGASRSSLRRAIQKLTDDGKILRVDGKRFGHWEIL